MTTPGSLAQGVISRDHFPTVVQMLAAQTREQSVLCRNREGRGLINMSDGRIIQIQWQDDSGVVSDGATAFYLMIRHNQGDYIVLEGLQTCSAPVITGSADFLMLAAMQKLDEYLREQNSAQATFDEAAFALFDQVTTAPAAPQEALAPFTLVPALQQMLQDCGLTASVARVVVSDALSHHRGQEIGGQWTVPQNEADALIGRIEQSLPARRLPLWQAARQRHRL